MTKLICSILVGLALSFSQASYAQLNIDASDEQLIVKIKPGEEAQFFMQAAGSGITSMEELVPELGLYLVKFSRARTHLFGAMAALSTNDSVEYTQPDHYVTLRKAPNDADFSQQWSLNGTSAGDAQAQTAWNVHTGGVNSLGEDVVVAIVDDGIDVTHDDLKNNIWVNTQEIPDNGIDDDNNGYIDDIYGWNAYSNNGNIPKGRHSTHVAGIIGAEGNNGLMVSGVNWKTKMMSVYGSSGTTSIVLRAYGYVLKQKMLYLQTKGKMGANVVVTNSSFGVDRANCNAGDYRAWNDMYNAMGQVGILSVAATANNAWDIDVTGDVPTGCDSPYIVSVTNTNIDNKLFNSAGWGATTIDLGAPGTNILSTVPGNRVQKLTGTSMATPHVAGTIALMHSAANSRFARFYQQDPGLAALQLKEALLNSVDPNNDLKGKTVSGGRLNISKAVMSIRKFK